MLICPKLYTHLDLSGTFGKFSQQQIHHSSTLDAPKIREKEKKCLPSLGGKKQCSHQWVKMCFRISVQIVLKHSVQVAVHLISIEPSD